MHCDPVRSWQEGADYHTLQGDRRAIVPPAGAPWGRLAQLGLFAALLWIGVAAAPAARAGTPYEAQIGGFMAASLQTIITGEFAGRTPSNVDAVATRRICQPSDYADLRAATNDRAAFDAFHRRCHLIEERIDVSQVHAIARLPENYCEKLKDVFDRMMAEHINTVSPSAGPWIVFAYKGARYESNSRILARGAHLQSSCQDDGSLRISAPRKRPR
jgi:hypothetical protein